MELDYPDGDQIEPDHAKQLFEHCANLVLENMPTGSEFGIDLFAFRTGDKFKGVKMIPPGVHFVYASASDKKSHQCGPRVGFFHNFQAKELLVKRWSQSEEDFDDSYCVSEEQLNRYLANLRDLDSYLGAYRFSSYKSFMNLTDRLTPNVVQRLVPDCNKIRSVPYLVRDSSSESTKNIEQMPSGSSKRTEDNLLPDLKPHKSTVIRYTEIRDNYSKIGQLQQQPVSESMITQYHLDTSTKLEQSFPGDRGKDMLLSELQFSFITFLLCHVYDCFEHWKKLLQLVCLAESALDGFPSFYSQFAAILNHQLEHVPEDLFEDIVDSNNLVRTALDTFFQNVEECPRKDDIIQNVLCLRRQTEEKFGWQYNLERDDEQPVIVELREQEQ